MKLKAGEEAPELVNAFIEIPMNSNIKYEFDEEAEVMKVDRVLHTSMVYPFNYGFVPGTWAEDEDPIDILVLSNIPFASGAYVEARPIGMIDMKDESGIDTKVIAVPKTKVDPSFAEINDVSQLPQPIKDKMIHFFEHYKELEKGKWVKITGFKGAGDAKKKIQEAMVRKKK